MTMLSSSNKRIAKNSLILYVRQFFVMAISLYTSRVILKNLGIEDFGIYNVVGGIVAMMGILNTSMSVSTTRFITFDLGRRDSKSLKNTFNICFWIFVGLSFILLVFGAFLGFFFLNNYMTIPENRITAANWVLLFSLFASVNSIMTNPYNACIIAHERMNIFAYVSAFEVIMKLSVAFVISMIDYDRLIVYSILIFVSQVSVTIIYIGYCKRHFDECCITKIQDYDGFKQILFFSGWNLFGSIASLFKTQGLNIVINMFFSPVINASRGIAVQINNAVNQFFSNFYTAFRPQITKSYAQGDIRGMLELVYKSSIYSYYLMLLISTPLFLEMPRLLSIWLGIVPSYSIDFSRLILLITIVDSVSQPLMTSAQATGKIKYYQMATGMTLMLNVPLSYMFLNYGCDVTIVFKISLLLSTLCIIIRLFFLKSLVGLNIKDYISKVYGRCLLVTLSTLPLPVFFHYYLPTLISSSIIVFFVSILCTIVSVYLLGLTRNERFYINNVLSKKLHLK